MWVLVRHVLVLGQPCARRSSETSALFLFSSSPSPPSPESAACATETDDASTGDEADLTEGSDGARAVLALVNDGAVKADELLREARVTLDVGNAIIAHRDGADGRPGTADDDAVRHAPRARRRPRRRPRDDEAALRVREAQGPRRRGGATEVIFSPAPAETSHLVRIAKEIDLAQKSVDIAIYSFSDAGISARARPRHRARREGPVRVQRRRRRLPPARRPLARTKSGKLEAGGVDVRFVNKIMHHKFMIVDGPRDEHRAREDRSPRHRQRELVEQRGTRVRREHLIFKNQEELVLRFQREFDNMWAHSRDFASKDLPYELATTAIRDSSIPDGAGTNVALHVVELHACATRRSRPRAPTPSPTASSPASTARRARSTSPRATSARARSPRR